MPNKKAWRAKNPQGLKNRITGEIILRLLRGGDSMKIPGLIEEKIRKKLERSIYRHKSLSCKKVVTVSQELDKIVVQQMKEINNKE